MQPPKVGEAPQDQQNNNDGNTTQPEQGSEENAKTDDSNKPELHDGNIPNENGARGPKAVSRFFKPNEKPETQPDADKAADDRRDPWGTTDSDPFDSENDPADRQMMDGAPQDENGQVPQDGDNQAPQDQGFQGGAPQDENNQGPQGQGPQGGTPQGMPA